MKIIGERFKISNISYGVKMMLVGSFLFAIMSVLVKCLNHIPSVEIVFFRTLVSLVITLLTLKVKNIYFWGSNKKILLARGFFGASALVMIFATLQNMPLATAVLIHNLTPIFTAIIAAYFLGEKIYKMQWLFWIIIFLGLLIIKSFDIRVSIFYFVLGITGAFLSGTAYNCIRKLKQSEHPLVIVLYFPLVATPFTGIYTFFTWVRPQGIDWFFLIAIGLLAQIAQIFLTKAYQSEQAGKVASLNYFGVIYGFLFGFLLFEETFKIPALIGMLLVVAGVLLNVTYKHK